MSLPRFKAVVIALNSDAALRELEEHGENVRTARVSGRALPGEEVRMIDLISDRIREQVTLDLQGRRPAFTEFYAALDKAYVARRDEISRLFHAKIE